MSAALSTTVKQHPEQAIDAPKATSANANAGATNARKLCEATFGGVYIFDDELLHVVALDGVSPEGNEAINRVFPNSPSRGTSTGRAILSRAIVYIPDTTKDTEYQAKSAAQAAGFRSLWQSLPAGDAAK